MKGEKMKMKSIHRITYFMVLYCWTTDCKASSQLLEKVEIKDSVDCVGSRCYFKIMAKFKSSNIPTPTWQKKVDGIWKDINRTDFTASFDVFDHNMTKLEGASCPDTEPYCYVQHDLIKNNANPEDCGDYVASVRSNGQYLKFNNLVLTMEEVMGISDIIETPRSKSTTKDLQEDKTVAPLAGSISGEKLYIIIGGVAGGVVVLVIIIIAFLCGKYSTLKASVSGNNNNQHGKNRGREFSVGQSTHLYDDIASSTFGQRYDELDQDNVGIPNNYTRPFVEESSPYRDPETTSPKTMPSVHEPKSSRVPNKYAKKDSLGYLEPQSVETLRGTNLENPMYSEASSSHRKLEPTYSNSEELLQAKKSAAYSHGQGTRGDHNKSSTKRQNLNYENIGMKIPQIKYA